MAYVGNVPAVAYTNTVKDTFSGDGSTVAFTMSLPSTTNNVRVVVENVIQDPTVAYSVSGTTLTFTSAPPSGTDNIYVVHLGPAVQTVQPPTQLSGNFTLTGDLAQTGDYTLTGDLTATTLSGDGSALTGVGKVLQVVTATNVTRFVTTSTSFVADNLQASITPTSATSKILVLVSSNGNNNNTSTYALVYTLYRGATNLGGATFGFGWVSATAQRIEVPISIVYLDSPNTTSSTTYGTYIRSTNAAATVEKPSVSSDMTETITLLEIAG